MAFSHLQPLPASQSLYGLPFEHDMLPVFGAVGGLAGGAPRLPPPSIERLFEQPVLVYPSRQFADFLSQRQCCFVLAFNGMISTHGRFSVRSDPHRSTYPLGHSARPSHSQVRWLYTSPLGQLCGLHDHPQLSALTAPWLVYAAFRGLMFVHGVQKPSDVPEHHARYMPTAQSVLHVVHRIVLPAAAVHEPVRNDDDFALTAPRYCRFK